MHTMRPGANLHGNVNIMLGGAMLSVAVTVVCFVCFCCHRNIKKRTNSLYRQQWLETEANMDIYSVEQYYDPPTSSYGGGFFLDSGIGDYQPLPVAPGAAINHPVYHQHQMYQCNHLVQQLYQQQQHKYAPYPNAPPPSYDTVVAQDELMGLRTQRKRHDTLDETTLSADCKDPSCNGALLRKASVRVRFADVGGRSQTLQRQQRTETAVCSIGREEAADDDVTEPYCRSIELEEAEGQEVQEVVQTLVHHTAETTNCGSMPLAESDDGCLSIGSHVLYSAPGWLDGSVNSAALLIDYDGNNIQQHSAATGTSRTPDQNRTSDRRNDIQNGSNMTILNSNEYVVADNIISNLLTIPTATTTTTMTSSLSSLTTTRHGQDTTNNNAGCPEETAPDDANETTGHPQTTIFRGVVGPRENINMITGTKIRQDSHLIEILMAEPETQLASASWSAVLGENVSIRRVVDATIDDLTNGEPQLAAMRRPLDFNGLVRLDTSQIIDHTGLPTYEVALKLESSGYV